MKAEWLMFKGSAFSLKYHCSIPQFNLVLIYTSISVAGTKKGSHSKYIRKGNILQGYSNDDPSSLDKMDEV